MKAASVSLVFKFSLEVDYLGGGEHSSEISEAKYSPGRRKKSRWRNERAGRILFLVVFDRAEYRITLGIPATMMT
jgi:hypothetical protein